MGSSTSRLAMPYPVGTDPTNVPADVQALAARVDLECTAYVEGTAATFGSTAAGVHGRVFYTTDTKRFYWDTGTLWVVIGGIDNLVTAKGDMLVATAAAVITKLTVGADGLVLMADSSQSAGVKWGTAFKNFTQAWHIANTLTTGLKNPAWIATANATLRGARARVASGSGAKFQMYVNGAAPTGMTDSPAVGTSSVLHDFPDVDVVAGDIVQVNCTNAGTSASDMSITLDAIWR